MADDGAKPSFTGTFGSKFVSEKDIEEVKARRDEQWKAAYARIGQEPPPREEAVYDGRTLAEKLAANKAAKQEEWESKHKLGNQFRALEPDEISFLDSVAATQSQAEKERKEADSEAVNEFKAAVAAARSTQASTSNPTTQPAPTTTTAKSNAASVPPKAKAKAKPNLKGVVISRKRKSVAEPPEKLDSSTTKEDAKEGGEAKRRKIESN